ncbi:NAD-dependent epimerase/dehydratase family protein [Umezawaea tangerina]|uniref:Nucleoside-diphosphate-sugar epimerase n=1 Tax=Umezawaea tangerina TaxID=84725 RepID=A0A2T0T038_9PSEU|nr:NAD-dependent epimerase/dehydratase family protein [Umezawaea tangerina]PRY39035.1 nucleoside-diphosphate-sugar epimerase [Umezawaea tangerina]
MRLLVLGGTHFLGRAVVSDALARGWDVTVFRRGISGADPEGVRSVRGDYTGPDDVVRLASAGPWDAVVDTLAYVPRETLAVASALRDAVRRYVLVSTLSVYAGWPVDPLTEDSPVLDAPADAGPGFGYDGDPGPSTYGFGKAGCERAVIEVFGADRAAVLRVGVVLGPHEYVGRGPWWLRRVRRGGRVLAPGDPRRPIQPVDVRDVADFALRCAEGTTGVFNVAGSGDETFGDFLAACADRAAPEGTEVVWVPDEVLVAREIRQWTGLPMWRTHPGTWAADTALARAAGLVTRSLAETVCDTWEWLLAEDPEPAAGMGITPDQEAEVLAAYRR